MLHSSAITRASAQGLAVILLLAVAAGCGGPPPPPQLSPPDVNNSVLISKPFDQVWAAVIPAIGRSFFVINNVAKDSGLINLTYSGGYADMINCNFTLPQTRLEGRMNIVFQKITDTDTRVTVNVRYQTTFTWPNGDDPPIVKETQFNTAEIGMLDGPASECASTGNMERSILELVSSSAASDTSASSAENSQPDGSAASDASSQSGASPDATSPVSGNSPSDASSPAPSNSSPPP